MIVPRWALGWFGPAAVVIGTAVLVGNAALLSAQWWFVPLTPPHIGYPVVPLAVIVSPADGLQRISTTRCNYTAAPVTVRLTRRVTNIITGDMVNLGGVDSSFPPGCVTVVALVTAIMPPGTVTPGRYQLSGTATSTNRWGRVVIVPWHTEPFTVGE